MSKRKPPFLIKGKPLNTVFRRWWERLQDFNLAREGFLQSLADEELVALRHDPGKPPRREKASYWKDARLEPDSAEPLTVVVVEPDGSLSQAKFFVWGPKLKQLLPEPAPEDESEETPERTPAGTASPPAQRGRPPVHDWAKIVVEICWHFSGKGPWGKFKQRDFLKEMQNWCKQELGTVPSEDELKDRCRMARKRFPRC